MVRAIARGLCAVALGAPLAACFLFADDLPDRSCATNRDCFTAQGEVCNPTTLRCEHPIDAGPTPDRRPPPPTPDADRTPDAGPSVDGGADGGALVDAGAIDAAAFTAAPPHSGEEWCAAGAGAVSATGSPAYGRLKQTTRSPNAPRARGSLSPPPRAGVGQGGESIPAGSRVDP